MAGAEQALTHAHADARRDAFLPGVGGVGGPAPQTRRRLVQSNGALASLAGVALLAVAVMVRDPHVPGTWGVCPTRALLGVDCPGCGSLRALHDLAAGHWVESFGHNALVLPAIAFVAFSAFGRPGNRWSMTWLVALLGFTLLRNLPNSPLAA
jgi:hypothetical protein